MTIPRIRSDNASPAESGEISRVLSSVVVQGTDGSVRFFNAPLPLATTNPTACTIYRFDVASSTERSGQSFSDFDNLVASLESDATSASELHDGRQWVASTFYSEDRPTLSFLRLAAGLSQRQLGDACGLEQPHVSRYESGKHEPSLTTATRMARALAVDLETFSRAWEATRAQVEAGK